MKNKNEKLIIILVTLSICMVCGFICFIIFLQESSFVKITINNQEISLLEYDNSEEIDINTLNSKYDTVLNLDIKNAKVKINGQNVSNQKEISLGKLNISRENKVVVEVKKIGELKYKEYRINTLPSTFPEYSANKKSEPNGEYEYYATTYTNSFKSYIYIINQLGEVSYYKQTNKTPYNFKKNENNGKITYTYLENTGIRYEGINDAVPTRLVVLDDKFNEIGRIGYKLEENIIDAECHDYYYFDENHYIIGAYTLEKVNNVPGLDGKEINVWNFRLQEVQNGEVIWEFQSINHKELYEYFNTDNMKLGNYEEAINYMHFNSMEIDPKDNNLVCSFRNIDAILKISRKTGKIIWVLGGKGDQFGLKDNQKFYKQHSISYLSNNDLLIYNNGNGMEKTKILILKLDEKKKQIESYKSYELDEYAPRMGSVEAIDETNNIYLVTYGTGRHEYAFEEINLETKESYFTFKLLNDNTMYCVNEF